MGITWRSAMPLLSTLAALVIIVHSAEENLDRDHRYDLKPRYLDTRPSDTEQPWREVRAESFKQQALPADRWDSDSLDEARIRRRVGRKRKRRPPLPSSDETDTFDPPAPEENLEVEETKVPETPKRRKRPRFNRWADESTETARPIRRRGQKRKRPTLKNWPELSEFGVYPRNKMLLESDRETIIQTGLDDDDIENQRNSYAEENDDDSNREIMVNRKPAHESRFVLGGDIRTEHRKPKNDKSLSEFSMELLGPVQPSDAVGDDGDFRELRDKMMEKAPGVFHTMNKVKEQGPIDALTLKDILKRSNGTSLSEILQQHNLTLADLLNGKENAIAVLKSTSLEDTPKKKDKIIVEEIKDDITTNVSVENNETQSITKKETISTENKRNKNDSFISTDHKPSKDSVSIVESVPEETVKQDFVAQDSVLVAQNITEEEILLERSTTTVAPTLENRTSGMLTRRRIPGTIRRKLRMRPMVNNTYKSQINRDLMALSARRYVHNRRNITKGKEWREMIPIMLNVTTEETNKQKENTVITTTAMPEETTTMADLEEPIESTTPDEPVAVENVTNKTHVDLNIETTTISVEILATELDVFVTERPRATRPLINPSGQRRQSFNNRLKKKRMKQKTSTTEAPQDDIMKNLLELGDLVSSSEFIARTQLPSASLNAETVTELEDFLTTQSDFKNSVRSTRQPSLRKTLKSTVVTKSPLLSSTEETAKIEIEEILNDTHTSAKLSKILRERNMTLAELLEHRERGSSHVHLADIFHNASREPNPPEPFLSKSSIEPISKETYPLRALLDANLHETPIKATTVDSILTNQVNIPVIMDFGNNVNENAENMGIMSLFNNYTKKAVVTNESNEQSTIQKDSKGVPYKSTVITVNTTDDDDTTRESRMLDDDQDMISWNEIFSMIRKNHKNETKALEKLTNEISPSGTFKKVTLEEDVDGDGVIVLEDLQHLKDLDTSVGSVSQEKIEFNTLERTEILETGILNKEPNSAKSVTVATASIVGLAMILFLLTYAALKWRQQRNMSHKKTFCDDRIPSPVFENRKGAKNCSSRSISPMLPTSNIYTMNTLESQNGKDSPEYMWDTLRKPFQ